MQTSGCKQQCRTCYLQARSSLWHEWSTVTKCCRSSVLGKQVIDETVAPRAECSAAQSFVFDWTLC